MKKGLLFVFICLLFSIFFYSSASDLPTALNLLKAKLLTLAISLKEQKTLVKALFLNDFKTPVFKKGEPQKESAASFSQASKEYGNKTTNLCVLRSLLSDLNDDIKKNQKTQNIIKVPDFWGLKHDALWQYIQQTVNQDWASFITAQGDAKTLTDEAKTFLKNIQKNINFLFKNEKNIPKSLAQEISTFIKDKQNKLLMIRSTGREDTLKIANAGGNETITGVKPELENIWEAIGDVIASYFGEKSLSQRLISKDDIKQDPFVPVLIQEMIGEYGKNAPVPTSGVMFTREPLGYTPEVVQIESSFGHGEGIVNSKVAADKFYIGPSGIIHATLREKKQRLVYNPQTKDLDSASNDIKKIKTSSLSIPVIENLNSIARKVEEIYNWPMDIEFVIHPNTQKNGYDIYLLQARPIVIKSSNASHLKEDYLKTHEDNTVKGSSIGVAGGTAWEILEAKHMIISDDINTALTTYNDNPERDVVRVIIVKKMAPTTSHEATTFRAYEKPVLFLSEEKCKKLETWGTQKLFVDTQRGLVVKAATSDSFDSCVNKGWVTHPIPKETSLWVWNKDVHALLEKSKDKENIEKRINTLAPLLTEAKEKLGEKHSLTYEVETLISAAKMCVIELHTMQDFLNENKKFESTEKELMQLYPLAFYDAIKYQLPERDVVNGVSFFTAITELSNILVYKKDLKHFDTIKGSGKKERFESFIRSKQYVLNEANQAKWVSFINDLSVAKNVDTEQLSYLIEFFIDMGVFEIWINTVFFKTYDTCKANAKETLETLLKEYEQEKETTTWVKEKINIINTWKEKKRMADWAEPDKFEALYKEFQKQFITELIAPDLDNYFKETGELTSETLPNLINTKEPNPEFSNEDWEKIIKGTPKYAVRIWGTIASKNKDRKKYEEARKKTFETMETFVNEKAPLASRFVKGGKLSKLILNGFLGKIVTVYDTSIKNFTESPLYKKTEKTTVKNFAKLLNGYLCLQDQWAILCKKHEKTLYLQNAEYSEPATTESYLLLSWPKYRQEEWVESLGGVRYHYDRLSSRINIEKPETLLKASSKFNVEAAKIGSMFDPGRIIPSSFEDMFTLFHQNLLTCQSVINNDLGLTIEILPAFVKNICDMLPKKGTPLPPIYKNSYISKTIMNCGVEFIGLKVSRTHITVHFNIPMRQHSGILRVICNTRKPEETKIFLEFMGHNEHNRWEHFAAFASFIACAFGIKETQRAQAKISKEAGEKEGASSVSFEWIIGKNGLSKEISLCLYDLISHTTDGINFNEEIFTYASGLKYNEDLDIKKSTFGKSFSSEKPFLIDEKIFLNKFPEFLDENKVPKEWFGYNLFLNDTFMQIFYDNKNYNRALDVIEMTIQQMIKTADFSYKKRIQFLDVYSKYGGYLFDYCLLYLGKIMALHNNDTTQRVEKILNDIINALRKSEVILADKENYERYKTIYKKIDGHYFFNVFYRNWFNKSDYNELMKTITNGLFQLFANANFKEFYLELFLQDPMNSIVYSLSDMNDFKGAYTWLIQPDIVEKIIQTIEDLRLYKNDKIFIEKMEKNLSKGKKSIEENIDYICKKLIGLIYQEYESQNKIDKVPQIVLDIVKKYKIKG